MQAHLNLIKFALAKGHTVSVDIGEGDVFHNLTYKQAKDHVESVEMAWINVFNVPFFESQSPTNIGHASVILDGDDDTIVDYIVSDFMTEWEKQYYL